MHHVRNAPKDKRVFHTLDAARGVAAVVVVLYHMQVAWTIHVFKNGNLAVDFFFGLSGFVLSHAYLQPLVNGRLSVKGFMVARLIRLFPLYFLSQLVLLPLLLILWVWSKPIPWTNAAILGKLPFSLVMLPSPSMDPKGFLYSFNIPAWSIFFELAVNVPFALYCRSLTRPVVRWAIIAVSGVLLAAQLAFGDQGLGGATWDTVLIGIPRITFSFFLGMQLYEWHGKMSVEHWKIPSFVSIVALAGFLAYLYAPPSTALTLAAIFVLFPLLILLLSVADLPEGRFSESVKLLGLLSYAVYILHSSVIHIWRLGFFGTEGSPSTVPTEIGLFVTILLCSWLADKFFDRPVRRFLSNRFRRA